MQIPMRERTKITLFCRVNKSQPTDMSADEWFQCALDAAKFAEDCGPFDPAYPHFIRQVNDLMEFAAIAERYPGVNFR